VHQYSRRKNLQESGPLPTASRHNALAPGRGGIRVSPDILLILTLCAVNFDEIPAPTVTYFDARQIFPHCGPALARRLIHLIVMKGIINFSSDREPFAAILRQIH
jgi:hypothetical protein